MRMTTMIQGKKVVLNDKDKDDIIQMTLDGVTTVSVCKHFNMTTSTFYVIRKEDPFFDKRFTNAREECQHLQVEKLRNITDNCTNMTEVHAARIKSDNIKWEASKRLPGVYGDSLNLNVNHHIDLTSVLSRAAERTIPMLELMKHIESSRTLAGNADTKDVSDTQVIETTETKRA